MYCRSVLSYSRNLYGVYVKHSFWVCYRVESKALQVCDVFFLILSFPGLFSSSGIRVRSTPHGVGNEGFKTFHNYKMFSIIKASDITAWFLGRSGRVMTKATLSSLFYLSERRSLLERGLPLTGGTLVSLPEGVHETAARLADPYREPSGRPFEAGSEKAASGAPRE